MSNASTWRKGKFLRLSKICHSSKSDDGLSMRVEVCA